MFGSAEMRGPRPFGPGASLVPLRLAETPILFGVPLLAGSRPWPVPPTSNHNLIHNHMNEPTDTTAFADTMRLVIIAPTDPKSPAPNPNLNPWLILRRDHLPLAFERLHGERHPAHGEDRQAFEAVLTELGTPFPKPAPFIALRMNTAQDGLPHAIGLRESLDWVAAETVAESLHTASLDDVPPDVIQTACAWALPQIFETVKLSVRTMMEDAAVDAIRDAGLTPRPTLEQILAERRKIFEGTAFAPLPPAEHQVVLDLIAAATPKARQYGLNPHQLSATGGLAA